MVEVIMNVENLQVSVKPAETRTVDMLGGRPHELVVGPLEVELTIKCRIFDEATLKHFQELKGGRLEVALRVQRDPTSISVLSPRTMPEEELENRDVPESTGEVQQW